MTKNSSITAVGRGMTKMLMSARRTQTSTETAATIRAIRGGIRYGTLELRPGSESGTRRGAAWGRAGAVMRQRRSVGAEVGAEGGADGCGVADEAL